jgi:hypothetical protein
MRAQMDAETDAKPSDRSALLMMLAYVEAECRRLGADAAAEHAAMAAALVPDRHATPQPRIGLPLH